MDVQKRRNRTKWKVTEWQAGIIGIRIERENKVESDKQEYKDINSRMQ